MKLIFLVLPTLFNCIYAQQLVDLKSFLGGNVKNPINAHAPYDVFVSATSDDADILNKIHLITEDKQNQTFMDLKNRKPFLTTSQIQPFSVQTLAYVTTNLTNEQIRRLTGMIYISTTKQLQVNNFHVIDIDKTQSLDLPNENQTILFLNSYMGSTPFKSSTISSWAQPSNASIYFYNGIPTDEPEKEDSFIFSNPVSTADFGNVFFPNVEKFSLSLGAFYIKYYGALTFQITPEYYDANDASTQPFTTTGFYMKPVNQSDETIRINTARDPAYSGNVGANIVGSLSKDGQVTVGEHEGLSFSQKSITPTN
ncbi:hypothetical protein CRE_18808 [Caenorhabditis remanei]|uniref:Uncharacterized protein n=1 Tax=Caenorhabditis remanei TaxID=31234 RepID=E3LKI6_CAERE|nr:hypothetical protein CRE_18808 [Caenorhabditis remanei]